jgi:starch synthase
LQKACGLAQKPDAPLFALVSRLTEQKGLHLLLQGLPQLLRQGGQLVLLGSGEPALEQAFSALAAAHPESVAVKLGFDEVFAHQAIAGADMILVPSRFEPCGLTQLYGLQYGTIPLVHHVGGLADTVADACLENLDADCATGFVFTQFQQSAFDAAVRRAFALYRRPSDFMQVQQCAMRQDVAWESAARAYLDCYRNISRQIAAPEY